MDLKNSNLGKSGEAGRVNESLLKKEFLILLILSEKKNNKTVGKTYLRVMRKKSFFRNGV